MRLRTNVAEFLEFDGRRCRGTHVHEKWHPSAGSDGSEYTQPFCEAVAAKVVAARKEGKTSVDSQMVKSAMAAGPCHPDTSLDPCAR